MDRTRASLTVLVLLALALVLSSGGKGCTLPIVDGGASLFVLLHDGTHDDAKFAELVQEVQDTESPVGKAIAAAGWKAYAPDDDDVMGDGKPNPMLVKLGVHGSITDGRRELLSVDPPNKIIAKEPIPPDATAESVLLMMKARGKR